MTSRAVWDPCVSCASDDDAYATILSHTLGAAFGAATPTIVDILGRLSRAQQSLFIKGQLLNGSLPTDIVKHNAQSYLEGWDTWAQLGSLTPHTLDTQPNKFSFDDVRRPATARLYWAFVGPLLHDTNSSLWGFLAELQAAASQVSSTADLLFMLVFLHHVFSSCLIVLADSQGDGG